MKQQERLQQLLEVATNQQNDAVSREAEASYQFLHSIFSFIFSSIFRLAKLYMRKISKPHQRSLFLNHS